MLYAHKYQHMLDTTAFLLSATVPTVLALGFFLGLKHAVEADHLAAVSTIASQRTSLWNSALIGAMWGAGHTLALLAVGVLVLLFNIEIGERAERVLELGVGIMLTLLGLNVIRKLIKGGRVHTHQHIHGNREHMHPHIHSVDEKPVATLPSHHGLLLNPRALGIGMVHGLAGSAALMLLIIPTIGSRPLGLVYILIFGAGSIVGMMAMSMVVGLPFRFSFSRSGAFERSLQFAAAVFSIGIGLWIVYQKAFLEGLGS